jgi:hypothetical protein
MFPLFINVSYVYVYIFIPFSIFITGISLVLEHIASLSEKLSSQVNANGFLKSKMQKLETQVLKSRFSYNILTEREMT